MNTGTFNYSRYSNDTYSSRSFYCHSQEKARHSKEDDMLLLTGQLKSGMFKSLDKLPRAFNKYEIKSPSRYVKLDPDLFIRNAANGKLDSVFVVHDEQRRKPFTVPLVLVEINSDPYWTTGSKYTQPTAVTNYTNYD